ncbi:hypothetical protein AO1008_03073 [Aspergillus oryzae 100-8]|uniref:Uncharacterized protein n=1 Tax=Aspergillus oryzae (strain 3.042) TaxID=1160506 RepID=I8A6Q6_ASPO3|nr:hypothetical protein Ao3042_03163 [Aspergillus oryzae 3.042]KDE77172.1 hypothetical protein AO1008_03073 [Aspergillus oryzae 100-8]|eukprot:EIT80364.1 hypothetical protein Ao3042_03163 [Aspergillus oryzae 3.042]
MQVTNEKQKPPWKIPSRSQILFCPPIQLSKDILLLFPFLEPKPNNSSNSSSSTVSSRILSSSFSFSPYPTGLHHSPSPRKRFGSLVGLLTCDLLSYRRVPFSSPSSYSVYTSIINRLRHHLFRLFCLSGGCQSIASVAVPPFPGAACE